MNIEEAIKAFLHERVHDDDRHDAERELRAMLASSDRLQWLSTLKANSFSLGRDDENACNYMTAAQWIEEYPDSFEDCTPEEIQAMKDTNTIWSLQIYEHTPIGFYKWHGPTAESVIDAARDQLSAPQRGDDK